MENNTVETLQAGKIGKGEVVVMAVAGAAPVMCVGGSMGTYLGMTGTGVALAVVLATILLVIIGLSYGSLAEKCNSCGGTYAYVATILGKTPGLWTLFVYYGVMATTAACPPVIFAIYLNSLTGIPIIVGWAIFAALMILLTTLGTELSTKALVIIFIAEMAAFIIPGIRCITLSAEGFNMSTSLTNAFAPSPKFGMAGILLTTLTWVWSFVGYEAPAFMGEEVKGGAKSVKFAIPVSAVLCGIIYVISCWLWTATMTPEQMEALANNGDALAAYCTMLGYGSGATLVSIGVMLAALACGLAFYQMMPRFLYDQARKGILSKNVAKLNKKQVPYVGMIIYAVVSFFTTMYAGYAYGGPEIFGSPLFDGVNDWFVVMAVCATSSYALVCIGHIKDAAKDNSLKGIIQGKILPAIAAAVIAYIIIFTIGAKYLLVTLVIYAVALVLALIFRQKKGLDMT
ncbi:MAG: APC family permease [Lachnospiraceae bacterium]|nr:APC family permease [Candidatus Equihabitans merdae]